MANVKDSSLALRFTPALDIALFKEVVSNDPFSSDDQNEAWTLVGINTAEASGKKVKVTARSARDRCLKQLSYFVTEDRKNLKRSGTDEEYSEKVQLLQEIKDLKLAGEELNKEKVKVTENRKMLTTGGGMDIRLAAMRGLNSATEQDSMSDDTDKSVGCKKQRISNNKKTMSIYELLDRKQLADEQLKQRQLHLEEKKLALEERKLALEEQKMQLMWQTAAQRAQHPDPTPKQVESSPSLEL